jgi:uroporphyrin-III C-methyltransferase
VSTPPAGKVYLVGAGPGDPELLTVKAHSLLRLADVILHDDLVSEAIVSLAGPHARVINVGKRCGAKTITQTEINRLMISFALSGMDVVRLKSGDPGIFGRLAEELDALAGANVIFEVVPGVTTALAAAASLGVALTDRRSSSKLVIVSGHHANGIEPEEKTDWRALVADHTTLVVYMPGRDLGSFSRQLMEAGVAAEIPSAVISRVSTAEERRFATTLGELSAVPATETPSIWLIGQAIGRASERILAETPIRDYVAPAQVLARRFAGIDKSA